MEQVKKVRRFRAYVEDSAILLRIDERLEQATKDINQIKRFLSNFDAAARLALLQTIHSEIHDQKGAEVTHGEHTTQA